LQCRLLSHLMLKFDVIKSAALAQEGPLSTNVVLCSLFVFVLVLCSFFEEKHFWSSLSPLLLVYVSREQSIHIHIHTHTQREAPSAPRLRSLRYSLSSLFCLLCLLCSVFFDLCSLSSLFCVPCSVFFVLCLL